MSIAAEVIGPGLTLLPPTGRVERKERPEDAEGDEPDNGEEGQEDVEVGVGHARQKRAQQRA